MIKINLLAEGKRAIAVRKGLPKIDLGKQDLGLWLLLAGLALGVAVYGVWHYLVQGQLDRKVAEVAAAQREVDELQQVIKEVEEFKAKKAELERKIAVINQLKLNQRGPVQIMDQVSRAMPELLWLTQMDVNPVAVTLRGQAFNTNAVASFIENLDRVSEFSEPVLIDTSQRGPVYDFVLTFGYQVSKPPAPPAAGAVASPRAG